MPAAGTPRSRAKPQNPLSPYIRASEYILEYPPKRIWWASGARHCEVCFLSLASA